MKSKQGFFSRTDWASFWTATAASFVVYFLTLGPSVGLEDSGELAVAGDRLGVPHPPGYPTWTMITWVFARLFSFVTFRGQPTPAWSISLASAVFGALAAGITAMLITRSSRDMLLSSSDDEAADSGKIAPFFPALCWASGVAGSLIFAFSPVMWSQATIVEVYALGAFFLMLVLLLTYRWMRSPSEKLLWMTAFVFGLGLTNYQVLLLGLVPLVIIMFLRNIKLFRDFILVMIPFGLTALVLQIGALPRHAGVPKHDLILAPVKIPNSFFLISALVVFFAALLVLIWVRGKKKKSFETPFLVAFSASAFLALLSAATAREGTLSNPAALLLWKPVSYVLIAAALIVAIGFFAMSAAKADDDDEKSAANRYAIDWKLFGVGLVAFLVALCIAGSVGSAAPYNPIYGGAPPYSWLRYDCAVFFGIAIMFALALTTSRGLSFAAAVASVQIILSILLHKGALLGLTHPTTWWFWTPILLNFVFLFLAWLTLPNGRNVAMTVMAAELGVSFYLYMPISSERNPPINWGYPRTWEGFKHAITRGQYEKISPTAIFSKRFLEQLGTYFSSLRTQFTLLIVPFGLVPFAAWRRRREDGKTFRALRAVLVLVALTLLFVAIGNILEGNDPIEKLRLDKLVMLAMLFIAAVGGMLTLVQQAKNAIRALWPNKKSAANGETAEKSAANDEDAAENSDDDKPRKKEFAFSLDDISQQWLIGTVVMFIVMSVALIALADPKGDLQDEFIQKVKYISSHGIFALWIGYGIAFAIAEGGAFFRKFRAPVTVFGCVCALVLALVPIRENYTNDQLVFRYSAAEQNGHDYGWQFGNYQLRGADAITEELEADEEPLPNPAYPPEMGQGAIFYGGTDPGRFVPTYMIFSANVRPDVFIITQNALADNTFMSVTRDLYADKIWIPTPNDSERAFQVYVEEVESGKRPRNADLTVENGRVQVSGALGVMEINGILCDMIFQHNKDRHEFFVEESYVIPWMYPYMTPNGLILRLNAEKTQLSGANVRNDLDFWDWYTRRLTKDQKWRRDLVAEKSFSKLRSAIAGLYISRGMMQEAEQAYAESRWLYFISPEANFRMIQDIYLRQGRYDEALDILEQFITYDPNNSRGPSFREYVFRLKECQRIIAKLGTRLYTGEPLSDAEILTLAGAYYDIGAQDFVAQVIETALKGRAFEPANAYAFARLLYDSGAKKAAANAMSIALTQKDVASDPGKLYEAAKFFAEAEQPNKMVAPLRAYLELRPNAWQSWLDLATIYAMNGHAKNAQICINKALNIDPRAQQIILSSPILSQIINQQ